ncbi:DUF2252 domain-containing protein [Roseateles koreensis]|uniref:DUF2252 family protein n=1 Tax=Roseateles koreensis TaxID=2987526 RepID=A0ABT5KS70_9BURK|nr:DUF2252 family protein [Roseateles koreensis]MDC8784716.1 DUF2252 family protein [Roseateles koreensis]
MDPVHAIRQFNQGREPERLRLKYRRMRADSFSFFRGSCHLFYAELPAILAAKPAPAVWACGDLHLENFGSYKGDDRKITFDINDFDEAALLPASWDAVRLLSSVFLAAPGLGLDERGIQTLCQQFLIHYASALADGRIFQISNEGVGADEAAQCDPVRKLLKTLAARKRQDFLDKRTSLDLGQRRLRLQPDKVLPASAQQTEAVRAFMQGFATTQPDPHFYKLLDVGRRVAGTGSLGIQRYVLLVAGKGSPDGNYLLDLKQALPSSVSPRAPNGQPAWIDEAERVVTLQNRLQAKPMAFLRAVELDGQAFVLRALQPTEDRLDLRSAKLKSDDLETVLAMMGKLLAWMQLRGAASQGAAASDELMVFGRAAPTWRDDWLAAAQACAARAVQDSVAFNMAYDQGFFNAA